MVLAFLLKVLFPALLECLFVAAFLILFMASPKSFWVVLVLPVFEPKIIFLGFSLKLENVKQGDGRASDWLACFPSRTEPGTV